MIIKITSIDTFEFKPENQADKAILMNINGKHLKVSGDGEGVNLYVDPDPCVEGVG